MGADIWIHGVVAWLAFKFVINAPNCEISPVARHITSAHTMTMSVLYAVAKLEFTSLMPIFARIVVIDVQTAPPRAKRTHTITISSVAFFLEKIMCLFSAYVNVLYIFRK